LKRSRSGSAARADPERKKATAVAATASLRRETELMS
jgi:hypothetical protein